MKKSYISSAVLLASIVSGNAMATNGYFTHGLGVKNKAMAGAGSAMPEETMATASNPAAAALLGDRMDAGVAIFSPQREFTASDSQYMGNYGSFTLNPGVAESGSNIFFIPHFAKSWRVDEDEAMAIAVYGRGGMNTDYSGGSATFDPTGQNSPTNNDPSRVMNFPGIYGATMMGTSGDTGVDLSQLFIDLTYAKKMGDLAVGGSLVIGVQSFEARGVATFAPYTKTYVETYFQTGDPMAAAGAVKGLSNNGHDIAYGLGFQLGIIYQATDALSLGLAYKSKVAMSEFDKYSDLFAENGGFDVPASYRLSASYRLNATDSIHVDYENILYSKVGSVANPIANLMLCPTVSRDPSPAADAASYCLGGNNGAGFGWDDMGVYKFGYQWKVTGLDKWTFRAGYSRGDQPVSSSEVLFGLMAPGIMEEHFTFGLTHDVGEREYSVSLMYAPSNTVKGMSAFDPSQQLTLEMKQFELEFGYSW